MVMFSQNYSSAAAAEVHLYGFGTYSVCGLVMHCGTCWSSLTLQGTWHMGSTWMSRHDSSNKERWWCLVWHCRWCTVADSGHRTVMLTVFSCWTTLTHTCSSMLLTCNVRYVSVHIVCAIKFISYKIYCLHISSELFVKFWYKQSGFGLYAGQVKIHLCVQC